MKRVDWSNVEDGLGSAEAVPALVAALASGKKPQRLAAFVALSDERLVHQGRVAPAAPLAVPLLAEALRAPKHPGRALVLALLATIAVGAPIAFARGAAGRADLEALAASPGVAGDAYRAVRDIVDDIAARLADKSGDVRARAAAALVFVHPEAAQARLLEELASDPDADVRITRAIGVGLAMRLTASPSKLDGPPAGANDAERAAHAIGRAFAGLDVDVQALELALTPPTSDVETPFGRLGDAALGAALALGEAGRAMVARALVAAPANRKASLATAVIRGTFPRSHQGASDIALVSSSALSREEMEAVRLVASVAPESLWAPLSYLPSVGMTRWLPDLRRFVGLDPRGPLERRVAFRGAQVEVIVVLDALARGEAEEDECRVALVAGASPADLVELGLVAPGNAYLRLLSYEAWTAERAVSFASSLIVDPSALQRLGERGRAADVYDYGAWVLLDAIFRLAPPGDQLLAELTPTLARLGPTTRGDFFIERARTWLSLVPSAVRDAVALGAALPAEVEREPRIRGRVVPPRFDGWNVLDLATDRAEAAARAARAVAAWTVLDDARTMRPLEAATRVLAALRPESRAAIEAALPTATAHGRSILEPLLRPN